MSRQAGEEKLAAGGVVIRSDERGKRVLLVHRPRYLDWSFPKGGVKEGETTEEAALREVEEETGLACRILGKLEIARYHYRTGKGNLRPKAVHYFLMEALSGHIVTDGVEVDEARWLSAGEAEEKLSYEADRLVLRRAMGEQDG
ncbi:MAG: NUDIX hydrolase [Acidobacteriota bacterium]